MSSFTNAHKRLEKEGLKWIVRKDKFAEVKNDTDYPENFRTAINPDSEFTPINYTLQDELVTVTGRLELNRIDISSGVYIMHDATAIKN